MKYIFVSYLVGLTGFFGVQSWSCTSFPRAAYSRPDQPALLPFQDKIETTTENVTYEIYSPSQLNLLTIDYFDSPQSGQISWRNCTFVGQIDTGMLTIRLETTYKPSGVYRLDKNSSGITTTPQCFTVFLLGVPSKPSISSNRKPYVGGAVTLTCSSVSTTTPSNHNLIFVYNWIVDDVENPTEARYTYSSYKRHLTMSNVLKGDTAKQFKCTATEIVTDGYTSASSNTFSITLDLQSWSCTTIPTAVYSRPDKQTLLLFQAEIESSTTVVNYKIFSPDEFNLLTIAYFNNKLYSGPVTRNSTFVGQVDTGQLTIRLETTYNPSGVYRIDKILNGENTTPQCFTLYILGVPSKPSISSDSKPYVGGAVTLNCYSVSTTTPSNHNLIFVYNWIVDDVENPTEARYTYSSDKRHLTISNVLKGDTAKQFKCTATENVTDGYTSASSNTLSITLDVQSWSCTNISRAVYSRRDKQTLLLFQAEIESSSTIVNYKIFSPDEFNLLTLAYFNNKVHSGPFTQHCTLVGHVDTGNLTIRLETTYNPSGVYRIDKILNGKNTTPQCFTVYILGVPSKPSISSVSKPYVGGAVTLTCSSVSTTTPSNHTLFFVYNWIVDDVENPTEARYTYSSDRRNLTMSNVLKGDIAKKFKCTATENITDGYKSASSNTFSITLDGVPSTPSITQDKNPHVGGNVTLTCSSVPTTTNSNNTLSLLYNWIVDDVENPTEARYSYTIDRRNLTLSNVMKEDSKPFKCSATANVIGGYTSASSNTFLLTVIYGPDRVELNVPETYFVTEGQPIENITCTADCYPGCSYRWMNNSVPVGSGGVIQLGTARRYHAGNYTCSARNTEPKFGKSSEQSTTIIVTCDEVKTSGNSSALIVDVVLGVLGSVLIGLGVFVAILIVKLRKLLYLKGRDVSGKSATPREMPCHANVTYNKDSTENEDWPTSSGLLLTEVQADNQYTSLESRSRNDASTYDVMIANH